MKSLRWVAIAATLLMVGWSVGALVTVAGGGGSRPHAAITGETAVAAGRPLFLSAAGSTSRNPLEWSVDSDSLGLSAILDEQDLKRAVFVAYAPNPGTYTFTVLASSRRFPWSACQHAVASRTVTVSGPGPGPGPDPGPAPGPVGVVDSVVLVYDPATNTPAQGVILSTLVSAQAKKALEAMGVRYFSVSVRDADAETRFARTVAQAKGVGVPALVFRSATGAVLPPAERLGGDMDAVMGQIRNRCGR